MIRFAVRRLIGMITVLFAISVIVFLIFNVIPNSDPAARIAGPDADDQPRCHTTYGRSCRCRCRWGIVSEGDVVTGVTRGDRQSK